MVGWLSETTLIFLSVAERSGYVEICTFCAWRRTGATKPQNHTGTIVRRRIALFGKHHCTSSGGVLLRHCLRDEHSTWASSRCGGAFAMPLEPQIIGCHVSRCRSSVIAEGGVNDSPCRGRRHQIHHNLENLRDPKCRCPSKYCASSGWSSLNTSHYNQHSTFVKTMV